MSARRKPPNPPTPSRPNATLKPGGPDRRAEAMQMLAEGHQLSSVARTLGLPRTTVRDWRDSPAGRKELDEARKRRAETLADAREAALRILRDGAVLAAQRLVDRASSVVPFEAVNAAGAILSHVGVPRSTKVEATVEPGVDLSKLSDDEIATLEALHAKARG